MASTIQREWFPPEEGREAPLMLYNSLVDEKTEFIPRGGRGSKAINWYTCGPTVYDSAHVGHARNYLTFDIVRRVLEDYFGYNCLFIMNVTDVDDKIVLRARRNYLLEQYKKETADVGQMMTESLKAVNWALTKQQGKVLKTEQLLAEVEATASEDLAKGGSLRKADELGTILKQENLKLSQIQEALTGMQGLESTLKGGTVSIKDILSISGDFLAEMLDAEKGASVTDASIFRNHAAKYEAEFLEDLQLLGCRPPDALTRVSEYMEEIVDYVKGIITAGFGYESNGSVYFSTNNYRSSGHVYGKLKPWAVGSAALAAEGESNFETTEKRHPSDFALWKAAKPGEPVWDSPWGKGRPGWHIECSAMASKIAGSKLDIHTGGEDLKFPHHDNELAQAEAFYHGDGCRQWVNYFLHCGHLNIEGLKMSKSLKNFITIREEMKAKEALLKNFFQNVSVAVRGVNISSQPMRWQDEEDALQIVLSDCQKSVHESLCDNINTRGAMDALGELIKTVNVYLSKKEASAKIANVFLLKRVAGYVTKILVAFGIVENPLDSPGFEGSSGGDSGNMAKYLDAFCGFRDEVRQLARAAAEPSAILKSCDKVRDETLVEAGLRLEDKPDGSSVWKLDDPEAMKAENAAKAQAAAEAKLKKLRNKLDLKLRERERFEKAMAPPEKYSRFDEATGNPTHLKDGTALEGKALDNARKDMDKVRKRRAPLEKKLEQDPNFLATLETEIQAILAEIKELE